MLPNWLPSGNKFGVTLLWALFILVLCAIPGQDLPKVWWLELLSIDKPIHAVLFFVLALLLYRNFTFYGKSLVMALALSASISITYGGVLEIMQGAIFQNRSADMYDFVANSTGVFLGCIYVYRKRI